MKTLNIFIENIYPDFKINEVEVLDNLKKITSYFLGKQEIMNNSCFIGYKFETLCFDVVLCDNHKIHEINKDYRHKDRPTDVISFAIFADSPEEERFIFDEEINLGEIIVSLDKVKEQSEEHNQSFEEELYFLLSHGVLHLFGFDHLTDEDYNFMVKAQNEVKAVLGV